MPPFLTAFNMADGLLVDAIVGGYVDLTSRVGANGDNVSLTNFGSAISAAQRAVLPTFSYFVIRVVCVRSQPQMIRIDACWVVACMADAHAIRDGAVSDLPRNSVG